MKRWLSACLLILLVLGLSQTSPAAKRAKVEILYMNHGPLMETLDKVKGVLGAYGDKVEVSWYDFESEKGERFKTSKGITQHVPLIIWIDGKSSFKSGGKEVRFVGFPSGAGPASFSGNWSMEHLREALDRATGGK